MRRVMLLLAILLVAAVFAAGCGGNGGTVSGEEDNGSGERGVEEGPAVDEPEGVTFTLAELAEFDGKDGRPAYVAVDGVVYEVTGSDDWPEGDHIPCDLDAAAGRDLSEVLRQAPARMRALIEAQPVVGTLE